MLLGDLSIAVIIPLYNGSRWIEETLHSVLAQTRQPDEIIVVDDGSTDDGSKIVERLARKHPIGLLRKPNGGQSAARNFGVMNSTSSLIALLDQDDIWYSNHLEILSAPFCEKQHNIPLGWAYSNVDLIADSGRMVTRNYLSDLPTQHPKRHLVRCLSEDMHVLPSASLINRGAFAAVGGFDEQLGGYEDDDLFLRLFAAGYDNVYITQALSQWRMTESSCGHSHGMYRSGLLYAEKLLDQFPDDECMGHYYGKHIIAPRFVRAFLSRYGAAWRSRNITQCQEIVGGLRRVLPTLPSSRKKTLLRLALPLMESPLGAQLLFNIMPATQRFLG